MSKKPKTNDEKPVHPEIADIDQTQKLLEICDRAAHDPNLKATHSAARAKLAELNKAIQDELTAQAEAKAEAEAKATEEAEADAKAAADAVAQKAKDDEAAAAKAAEKARAKETGYQAEGTA